MADPLSLALSIASIVQIGLRVSMGLAEVISAAQSAHLELTELLNDVVMLCEILRKIEASTPKWKASTADPLLPGIFERCRGSLNDLLETITSVQDSFVNGGLQKIWLQATWFSKTKEIAAIASKISNYKSTLALTLQMQNASDMGDVKEAIHTFLESKSRVGEENSVRNEGMEQSMKSPASSVYSDTRPLSYASGSVRASTSSTLLSRTASTSSSFLSRNVSLRFAKSVTTGGSKSASVSRDNESTLRGSEHSDTGFSTEPSSSPAVMFPQDKLESIHIPPALLGTDSQAVEKFWFELASQLQLNSPAPYSTYKELYLNIYPDLWLHGRVWHGDRSTYGTLLITRYSPQSGTMMFFKLVPFAPVNTIRILGAGRDIALGFRMERVPVRLGNEHPSMRHEGTDPTVQYGFRRVLSMSSKDQSSAGKQRLWPRVLFPADERVSRSSSPQNSPLENDRCYSPNFFELRNTSTTGLNRLNRSPAELFSALNPKLYTPDLVHPLKGIWSWSSSSQSEFMLFHQTSRKKLELFKLTGNFHMRRGTKCYIFEDIQAGVSDGHGIALVAGGVYSWNRKCTMTWVEPDYVQVRIEFLDLHFRRVNIARYI